MRWVVDEYFDDPGIDDVNRHLFAFAAYNAGPNRIARLQRLAPEYDVDPNVWFKNVERIVASRVSREPVRYVRNIYKYYLAYRRLRDLEKERGAPRGTEPARAGRLIVSALLDLNDPGESPRPARRGPIRSGPSPRRRAPRFRGPRRSR